MRPTLKQIFLIFIFLINLFPDKISAGNVSNKSVEDSLVTDANSGRAILLDEITLWADVKHVNKSPLRLKSVVASEISVNSAGRTFPELIREIPGIYSTSESGSYGDAKLNIRGYKQENISVMLNGIPITGLVSGSMFWNNWMGLSDATAQIQVQKGIGGSMISDNSIGGTVNIITKSPSEKAMANAGFSITESGTKKAYVEIGSGKLPKGWAFSLMGSYVWGSGWVEMTNVNSWAYMASISKKVGKNHSFLFTALGSPEQHEQRNTRLSYEEIERFGVNYNKNWGYYTDENGRTSARTIGRNTYFKPYFMLNHSYKSFIGKNNIPFHLNSAIYFTTASGGGYWAESKGKKIIAYQKDGHIDWDAVVADNKAALAYASTETVEGSAKNIMSDYIAGHKQYGVKTAANFKFSPKVMFEAGAHYLHYRTWEKEKITDLLGGAYWYEEYEKNSLMGIAGRNPVKRVGDYIRTYGGRYSNYGTVYAFTEYNPNKKLLLTAGASLNLTSIMRWDRYNYANEDVYSKWANGVGGSVKGGMLYKFSLAHSLYLNAGYNSRIPYYNVYFASGNNEISKDVRNERNILTEIGYRFVHSSGAVEINGYYTYWKNKTLMSNAYKPLDNEAYKFMITGLDAQHYGVEIEAYNNFTKWLYASVYGSFGVWKWKNDVHASLYDPYSGKEVSKVNVYSNNLPVGDSPQTQIGANIRVTPFSFLTLGANWQYNARYWADFEPSTRTDLNDMANPYMIPAYHLLNFQVTVSALKKPLGALKQIFFFGNLNNALNEVYVERGKDGKSHGADSFTGYWGQGRNVNAGVRFSF